jgi:hypothetical protein
VIAKIKSADPDILGSLPALRRAARQARKLAVRTNTPLYVLKKGKVVNLNPASKRAR